MLRILEGLRDPRREHGRTRQVRRGARYGLGGLWGRLAGASQRRRDALGFWRPLPWLLGVGWLVHRHTLPLDAIMSEDVPHTLVLALSGRGLVADPREVYWLDRVPGPIGSLWLEPRALVRAHRAEELSDIYLIDTRLSPEGALLEIGGIYNLTDTSAADERQLTTGGERAAWVIAGGGRVLSVHYLDLRGEPEPSGSEWTPLQRWQNRLTNLEETGRLAGFQRRAFKLEPYAERATLSFSADELLVDADNHRIRIPTAWEGPVQGARFAREQVQETARPGNLVTWAVDRVRDLQWFGSDRMQLLKTVTFAGLDWVDQVVGRMTGDDGARQVAEQLGDLADIPPVSYTDPETGWPPPPMVPILNRPLKGEGQWHSLDSDPFILTNLGAPSPFVTSFIRTDSERAYNQTFVLVWDPRQVALHAMSGTVEPKSATGETGPGLVPRKPEVMGRLLAGLNGGFQATHGEYGMMADGVVYLPPKPYAATVAELNDGSTGFGTWPRDENVPDNMISFRQNMTPLVMDGTVNPYRRTWWGGVPPGWTDESRTVRSALCMTKDGFVAYLYGSSTDADGLAKAMQRARCAYGIHLDMNAGHTGLEFYRAAPAEEMPELGRPLDTRWEVEGAISDMEGWRFRGRRMMRFMGLMNFPRYIQRESRDFFYLTLRHLLPLSDLAPRVSPPQPDEGKWKVKGLPQHGWPYALATTWLRPDPTRPDTKLRLLALDPRLVQPKETGPRSAPTVVTFPDPMPGGGNTALWLLDRRFVISPEPPSAKAVRLTTGFAAKLGLLDRLVAGFGIERRGMLLYAEIANTPDATRDGALLEGLLAELGCKELLWVTSPVDVALGGELDLGGRPLPHAPGGVQLVRSAAPGAVRIFPDTPVVPLAEWYPLQAKRVRYLRKATKPRTDERPVLPGPDAAIPSASAVEPPTARDRASRPARAVPVKPAD